MIMNRELQSSHAPALSRETEECHKKASVAGLLAKNRTWDLPSNRHDC